MAMHKAKILVLGPCESGKSTVTNFLSDSTESSGDGYHPTAGCRILEFEVNNVEVGSRTVNTEVELWDVSGDHKYEACWPAIARDTNGVIFVYNPDQPNYDKELESWYNYFTNVSGVRDEQCLVLAHLKPRAHPGQGKLRTTLSLYGRVGGGIGKKHRYFVDESNLKESQCVAFAHNKSGASEDKPPTPPAGSVFSKVLCVNTSIEDGGDQLRDEFNSFLSRLMTSISDKREQEELSIMKM